jgi:hypothetical protein
MSEKDNIIKDNDKIIKELDEKIMKQNEKIKEKDRKIKEKDRKIKEIEIKIMDIEKEKRMNNLDYYTYSKSLEKSNLELSAIQKINIEEKEEMKKRIKILKIANNVLLDTFKGYQEEIISLKFTNSILRKKNSENLENSFQISLEYENYENKIRKQIENHIYIMGLANDKIKILKKQLLEKSMIFLFTGK